MATFFNTATLLYNGTATNSNTTVGELVQTITATKTALSGNYTVGEPVSFIINIVNSGTSTVNALTVTDDLGAYVTAGGGTVTPLTYVDNSLRFFVNGRVSAAPAVTAGPPMTITGIDVPAGGNVALIYEATANAFAPLAEGSSINNTATVSGGGLTEAITADATIATLNAPRLSITKSMNPTTVVDNSELTYTFIIQNTGNTAITATDIVSVTDTFNPILNPITVTINGTPAAETTAYTYNNTTGEFATVPGAITVPAATYTQGADGTVTVTPGVTVLQVTGTI